MATKKKPTTTDKAVTSKQVSKPRTHIPNPTGKGGFKDNPTNRSDGRWSAENSISFQYKKLLSMTEQEREKWAKEKTGNMTGAEEIAYGRFKAAKKSLLDAREITDRTEGKAPQFIGLGNTEEFKQSLVVFVDAPEEA